MAHFGRRFACVLGFLWMFQSVLWAQEPSAEPVELPGQEQTEPAKAEPCEAPVAPAPVPIPESFHKLLKQGNCLDALKVLSALPENAPVQAELKKVHACLQGMGADGLQNVLDTTIGALEDNPLTRMGLHVLDSMNVKELLPLVKDIETKQGKNSADMLALGLAYEKLGELEKASEGLKAAVEKDPKNQTAMLKLALLTNQLKQRGEAEEWFRRYLALGTKDYLYSGYAYAFLNPVLFFVVTVVLMIWGGLLITRRMLLLSGVQDEEDESADPTAIRTVHEKENLLETVKKRQAKVTQQAMLAQSKDENKDEEQQRKATPKAWWLTLVGMGTLTVALGVNWFGERSFFSFTIQSIATVTFFIWTVLVFIGWVKPMIARLTGALDKEEGLINRELRRINSFTSRYQIVFLFVIPPVTLGMLSLFKSRDLQMAILVTAALIWFAALGTLSQSLLFHRDRLQSALKLLSFFNTLPFLFILLYLAGNVLNKMVTLNLSGLTAMEWNSLVASLLLYTFGLMFSLYLARIQAKAIVLPVKALTDSVHQVEDGDLSVQLQGLPKNEIGTLADGFNSMVEGLRQREFIRATFGKFVDPRVVENALGSGKLEMGGRTENAVVLFSDIRGFTAQSEKVTPQQMVEALNTYFTRMVRVIEAEGGLVNKYIGDAMMVVWGGLFGEEPNAARAIRAAIRMQEELFAYNEEREAQGLWPLYMGIGINEGEVVAGHLGSEDRMEWTVIGDTVNLAQRGEGMALPGMILVTPWTFGKVRETFMAQELMPVRVKGKEKPVGFYNILGEVGKPRPQFPTREDAKREQTNIAKVIREINVD